MRTEAPVLVVTDNEKTYHKMSLIQGAQVVLVNTKLSANEMIEEGISKFEENGTLEKGDKVVVVGTEAKLANNRDMNAFTCVINI